MDKFSSSGVGLTLPVSFVDECAKVVDGSIMCGCWATGTSAKKMFLYSHLTTFHANIGVPNKIVNQMRPTYLITSILLSHHARNRVFMGHMTQLQNCNYKGEVLPKKVFSYMCAYNNLPILKCHGCLTYFWRLSSILKFQSVAVTT
jgi:hypothetical protein